MKNNSDNSESTNIEVPSPPKTANLPSEVQASRNGQKRRSSSRSIKRKRFDDEIVEYSLGFPPSTIARIGRIRTHSQTYPTPVSTTQLTEQNSLSSVQSVESSVPVIVPQTTLVNMNKDKRKPSKSMRKKKRGRGSNQIATKDLGRWKPVDDLALIIGIQQTNDLRMVHRGTKFSCKFTIQEMQSRWYSLLYEEPISRIAVAAMRNLHPELVDNVKSKALYTAQEENLLGTIKSTDNPTLDVFQDLLEKNHSVFYPARTAKSLFSHWCLMKQYYLLPDQNIKPLHSNEVLSFSDAEDALDDTELNEQNDELLDIELALMNRKNKKEIRNIENELVRWSVLVESLKESNGIQPDFDNQTLAVLRGRLVRYLMRSKEITFGRNSKDLKVDIDLSLEGPAYKISRKQGIIKLRSNGDFFISNEGRRPIYIDGTPLLQGNKSRLSNNSVLEISGLRFVFSVNYDLINAIRHESAKTTTPLN